MKIKHIALYSFVAYSITTLCVQYNIPQLLSEFNRVGTFKPQAPNDFNEQRAWEIVRMMETASPTRAPRLELDLRRSLDARSGTTVGSSRLQKENQQLRDRISRLEADQQRQSTRAAETENCPAQLQACRERLDLFSQLASRVITSLNDFERIIIAAAHELENSAGWGFSTPENRDQRMASAEQFINTARTQVQSLGNLRTGIEQLFNTTP